MVMNYKEIPVSNKDRKKFDKGINLVNDFVDSLGRQGLLPDRFSQAARARGR